MEPTSIVFFVITAIILFWLFIHVPARMASNRGRNALVWVLVSLLIGPPIAIVALYAMGDA